MQKNSPIKIDTQKKELIEILEKHNEKRKFYAEQILIRKKTEKKKALYTKCLKHLAEQADITNKVSNFFSNIESVLDQKNSFSSLINLAKDKFLLENGLDFLNKIENNQKILNFDILENEMPIRDQKSTFLNDLQNYFLKKNKKNIFEGIFEDEIFQISEQKNQIKKEYDEAIHSNCLKHQLNADRKIKVLEKKVEKKILISKTSSLIKEINDLDLISISYLNFNSNYLINNEELLLNNLIFILDDTQCDKFLLEIDKKRKVGNKSKTDSYKSLGESVRNLKNIIKELENLKQEKKKKIDQKASNENKKKDNNCPEKDNLLINKNEKWVWVSLILSQFTGNSIEVAINKVKFQIQFIENEITNKLNILKESLENLNKSFGINEQLNEFLLKKLGKYERKSETISKIISEQRKQQQN